MGFITARDDWLVGNTKAGLEERVRYLLGEYNAVVKLNKSRIRTGLPIEFGGGIKWSRSLKAGVAKGLERHFEAEKFRSALYRPYVTREVYFGSGLVEMPNKMPRFFESGANSAIFFNDPGARAPFSPLASSLPGEFHLAASSDGFQALPRFRFADDGGRLDNITDWALEQFRVHYDGGHGLEITKDAIFHYVYAVLHDPHYREKYASNLKREFPRIPFHTAFWRWADWGQALMALHVDYQTVEPWPLTRIDEIDKRSRTASIGPRALLHADRTNGNIRLDTETQLTGVPPEAWDYRLGNRSALEWILDQHKEKTPRDRTIREKFNTYRFADYKDKVIDLLMRVTRVSVETVAITEAMRKVSDLH